MDVNRKLEQMDEELKLLKNEIKQVLLEIQEHVLNVQNPFAGGGGGFAPASPPPQPVSAPEPEPATPVVEPGPSPAPKEPDVGVQSAGPRVVLDIGPRGGASSPQSPLVGGPVGYFPPQAGVGGGPMPADTGSHPQQNDQDFSPPRASVEESPSASPFAEASPFDSPDDGDEFTGPSLGQRPSPDAPAHRGKPRARNRQSQFRDTPGESWEEHELRRPSARRQPGEVTEDAWGDDEPERPSARRHKAAEEYGREADEAEYSHEPGSEDEFKKTESPVARNGRVHKGMDLVTVAGLAQWTDRVLSKVGKEHLEHLVQVSAATGRISPEVKDVLLTIAPLLAGDGSGNRLTARELVRMLAHLDGLLGSGSLAEARLLSILLHDDLEVFPSIRP
jgi:hypothetical protein